MQSSVALPFINSLQDIIPAGRRKNNCEFCANFGAFSPGIWPIRQNLLQLVQRELEAVEEVGHEVVEARQLHVDERLPRLLLRRRKF